MNMNNSNTSEITRLKSKVCKLVKSQRDYVEEFNETIQFIQNLLALHSSNEPTSKAKVSNILNKHYEVLNKMITNEYFCLLYKDNLTIKQFILNSIEVVYESNNEEVKIKTYKIVDELLQMDINFQNLAFRSTTIKYIIQLFLYKTLVPHLVSIMKIGSNKFQLDRSNLTTVEHQTESSDKIDIKRIKNLANIICYVFITLPFNCLVNKKFLPRAYEFFSESMTDSLTSAQIKLAISVNICDHLNNSSDHYEKIENNLDNSLDVYDDVHTRILMFENCIEKAIDSLRINIRCGNSRPLLKQAFNIYTEYLDSYLKHLKESSLKNANLNTNEEELDSVYEKWQQLLYKVIIGIIRILRSDFESNENKLEIDLVIYFYELVKLNIKHLGEEDSTNIACKLVSIIVKLYEWSEKMFHEHRVTENQTIRVKTLSFELIETFMSVLKFDFCVTHWMTFEPLWSKCLIEWNVPSYRVIAAFLKYNNDRNVFPYAKALTKTILKSWIKPTNHSNQCDCNEQIKNVNLFLKKDILDAIIDITYFYDGMIQINQKYLQDFMEDIYPLLNIITSLFSNEIISLKRLKNFIRFHTKLLVLKSTQLKNTDLWRENLSLIIKYLNYVGQKRFEFEDLDFEVYDSVITLVETVQRFFNSKDLEKYNYFFNELLIFVQEFKDELMEY